MIQPGMMFGGEGPVMSGTWYNPHTGDAFTVRDSFFEDNQYVVTTTDGRYFRYDQLQNYVQSDMKLEDLKKMKIENKPVEKLPAEVSELIDTDAAYNESGLLLPEDEALISSKPVKLGNIANNNNANYINRNVSVTPTNMNTAIIEKALKNVAKPDFSINIEWENYPVKEIEMLKDIMEIPSSEIIDWYLDNIQLDDFILAFKTAISEKLMLDNIKSIETEIVKLPEPEEVINIVDTALHEVKVDNDDGALAKEPKPKKTITRVNAAVKKTSNKKK